jgi:hypothetical protein
MEKALSPEWVKWRENRLAQMLAGGVRWEAAEEFSRVEAAARSRIACTIGFAAAAAAELDFEDAPDGTTRWFVIINPALVSQTELYP